VLTGARISADARANSIIVTAPAESMELIAALINQLDQAPNAAAELKVFTIVNGDATSLAATAPHPGPSHVKFALDERDVFFVTRTERQERVLEIVRRLSFAVIGKGIAGKAL
jgi:hypothetical protein